MRNIKKISDITAIHAFQNIFKYLSLKHWTISTPKLNSSFSYNITSAYYHAESKKKQVHTFNTQTRRTIAVQSIVFERALFLVQSDTHF